MREMETSLLLHIFEPHPPALSFNFFEKGVAAGAVRGAGRNGPDPPDVQRVRRPDGDRPQERPCASRICRRGTTRGGGGARNERRGRGVKKEGEERRGKEGGGEG